MTHLERDVTCHGTVRHDALRDATKDSARGSTYIFQELQLAWTCFAAAIRFSKLTVRHVLLSALAILATLAPLMDNLRTLTVPDSQASVSNLQSMNWRQNASRRSEALGSGSLRPRWNYGEQPYGADNSYNYKLLIHSN